jgi:hypothetical protein
MDTKLTLMLDKRVIERAKAYARKHHKSLSGMVENYFKNLTERPKADDGEAPPLVKSLKGIAKLPGNFDFKKEYARYLEDRYR